MFNTKASGGFDQMIIDRIMDLFRVKGLIPKRGDSSHQARDFEPSNELVASFHQIRKNCHDLCLGFGTPESADLVDRYLKLTMTLSGETRNRTFGVFMESIAAQIASGKSPDFDTTGWPPFQPQGYSQMNMALNQLFQRPSRFAMAPPPSEIMLPMGKAVQAMYLLNGIELHHTDISNIALGLIHQGITDPAVACATIYKNHMSNPTQPMRLVPDTGTDLHFVKLAIVGEVLELNPFNAVQVEELNDMAKFIFSGYVAGHTFTRSEVAADFKKAGSQSPVVRISRVVWTVLMKERMEQELLRECVNRFSQALMQLVPEFYKAPDYNAAVVEALVELRSQISVESGGTKVYPSDDHPVLGRVYAYVTHVLNAEGINGPMVKQWGGAFARALVELKPDLAKSTQFSKDVRVALEDLRSKVSVHEGGTMEAIVELMPRQLGEVEVMLKSNVMDDEPADSALLADSALMLAGIDPDVSTRVNSRMVALEGYHFEREDDFHVIAREYGVSPQGNPLQGAWVCRNYHTGEYIDHDRYRADLFERLNVSRLDNV